MEIFATLLQYFLHIDEYLVQIVNEYGMITYIILFAIIFAETGLVVTPFLPGDSLIFAAGAIAAKAEMNINVYYLFLLMATAAILGDAVNYWIGSKVGPRAYTGEIKLIKKEYIEKTHAFFNKHGGKTIFLARFVPIVRTFAPFVAGVGDMSYGYFLRYNFFGGIVWVGLFLGLGYFFGNIPFVQKNFELVIIGIILVSVVPMVIEYINHKRQKSAQA